MDKESLRTLGTTFFILTLMSLPLGLLTLLIFFLLSEEDVYFRELYFEKNLWKLSFFSLIGITSLVVGIIMKKNKMGRCLMNLISSGVCIPLILVISFSRIRYLKAYHNTSIDQISNVENELGVNLPHNVELHKQISSITLEENLSIIKIIDANEKRKMDELVQNDERWVDEYKPSLLNVLDYYIYRNYEESQYHLFYVKETNSFNTYPVQPGKYHSMFVFYNIEIGKIVLTDSYSFEIRNID